MHRIPRKKKKKIPKDTFYCYTATSGMIYPKDGLPYYTVKKCPYYTGIKGVRGHCSLLKCDVFDQVKECGQRLGNSYR
jgi:hypothetical protein